MMIVAAGASNDEMEICWLNFQSSIQLPCTLDSHIEDFPTTIKWKFFVHATRASAEYLMIVLLINISRWGNFFSDFGFFSFIPMLIAAYIFYAYENEVRLVHEGRKKCSDFVRVFTQQLSHSSQSTPKNFHQKNSRIGNDEARVGSWNYN